MQLKKSTSEVRNITNASIKTYVIEEERELQN